MVSTAGASDYHHVTRRRSATDASQCRAQSYQRHQGSIVEFLT